MKIYVVLYFYEYEGYDEPRAAFTTREAAQAYIDGASKTKLARSAYEIFEMEVKS